MYMSASGIAILPQLNSLSSPKSRIIGFSSNDSDACSPRSRTDEASRTAVEQLSQSPNKALAIEAESVFQKLLGVHYKSGNTITDPVIAQFVDNTLKNDKYSFQEKLAHDQEVRFLNARNVRQFDFYGTKTQTAKSIFESNSGKPLAQRQFEQDTEHKVQLGMLTIDQSSPNTALLTVSSTKTGASKYLTLAI